MGFRRREKIAVSGVLTLFLLCGCSPAETWKDIKAFLGFGDAPRTEERHTLHIDSGGIIKTLDPALAGDLSSRNMVNALYDTLLQYDYAERPYRLKPSMLAAMPELSEDGLTYRFRLREDLYFTPDPCFGDGGREARQLTSRDAVCSFRRIADGRMHSPVFWMFRHKIRGVDEFWAATSRLKRGASAEAVELAGIRETGRFTFEIELTSPDPGFIYNFAIPYTAVVSGTAAEYYDQNLTDHVVGSGPFVLEEWVRDYRMTLRRNREYREEFFNGERLPLAEKIECLIVKQPFAGWLMFLTGDLDYTALDKDNLDLVSGGGGELAPALAERGIKLLKFPLFEVRYIGFNFLDPMLGENLPLRRALTLAYNIDRRIEYSNFQLQKGQGAIPPGVPGYEADFVNPDNEYDLERAKELMAEAGYPGGIDPATGAPLVLRFDQNGSGSGFRQLGELMESDMAKLGIKVISELNNGPRFFAKLNQGEMQLFRLSWIGDYPDAENFLQLFYSKNIGSSNRVGFSDPEYDRMYEEMLKLPPEKREESYRKLNRYLVGKSPWIFESYPVSHILFHEWVKNLLPHDFAFGAWKYLGVDPDLRDARKRSFRALDFSELRN